MVGKIVLVAAGLLTVVTVHAFSGENTIRINVEQRGPDRHQIHLIIPAGIVRTGLYFIPDQKLKESAREIGPWLPAARLAVRNLKQERDFDFVEVKQGSEHVSVRKQVDSLLVDVEQPDQSVHLSVPLKVVESFVKRLEETQPAA